MKNYVVWMDSDKAHVFALETSGIEKSQLKKHKADHHTQNEKDKHSDEAQKGFFRDLAMKLKDADQLLILGPGLAKNHFKTHLETHHSGGLDKKIIGIENSDHPTDNQVLATARNFFKTYDLFNNPIKQS